jgi:hypothetical protein
MVLPKTRHTHLLLGGKTHDYLIISIALQAFQEPTFSKDIAQDQRQKIPVVKRRWLIAVFSVELYSQFIFHLSQSIRVGNKAPIDKR